MRKRLIIWISICHRLTFFKCNSVSLTKLSVCQNLWMTFGKVALFCSYSPTFTHRQLRIIHKTWAFNRWVIFCRWFGILFSWKSCWLSVLCLCFKLFEFVSRALILTDIWWLWPSFIIWVLIRHLIFNLYHLIWIPYINHFLHLKFKLFVHFICFFKLALRFKCFLFQIYKIIQEPLHPSPALSYWRNIFSKGFLTSMSLIVLRYVSTFNIIHHPLYFCNKSLFSLNFFNHICYVLNIMGFECKAVWDEG